jgi:hypothetical protein
MCFLLTDYVHILAVVSLDRQLELMSTMTEGSWLGEICCSLLENIVKLSNLSALPETPAVATARAAALRGVIRNALDFPVAAHFMK